MQEKLTYKMRKWVLIGWLLCGVLLFFTPLFEAMSLNGKIMHFVIALGLVLLLIFNIDEGLMACDIWRWWWVLLIIGVLIPDREHDSYAQYLGLEVESIESHILKASILFIYLIGLSYCIKSLKALDSKEK